MPPPVAPHPEALKTFAASRTGEFALRYGEILVEAFSRYGLILNAKQLRELAGGGSQTTAQRAIDYWRQNLSERLATRVRLGAQVPEEVLQTANSLLETLWSQAREHADREFALQCAQHETALGQATARLEEACRELVQVRSELDRAKELASSREAQLLDLRNDLVDCQAKLSDAGEKLQLERQAHAEHCARERSAQQALQAALRDSKTHADQLRDDLEQARRDGAQRHDRMLVEHREAVASVQRACDARLAEREAHVRALQTKLDAATAQCLELQMQAVRNASEIEHLTQKLSQLQDDLGSTRAELQLSQVREQATQAQLIEQLSRLQAPAP